jgi:hypothetical protein
VNPVGNVQTSTEGESVVILTSSREGGSHCKTFLVQEYPGQRDSFDA